MAGGFDANLSRLRRELQAKRLTFGLTNEASECKINEITGKTVIYSFRSITRNIVGATVEGPFGGVKQSGFGSEGGLQGIQEYLVTKFAKIALI
jgi:succinate-semialdehyde dehydrogenase/glutarate-semialdehyde dehydrogenase